MTTTTAGRRSTSANRAGIPAWVVGLVVAAVAAGGGWGLWKFWRGLQSGGSGAVVSVDEKPSDYRGAAMSDRMRYRQRQQEEMMRARREAELTGPDFVRERPRGGGAEAKGGKTRLTAVRGGGGRLRLTLEPVEPTFISAENRQVLIMGNRVVSETAVARQVGATPEQVTALSAIPRTLVGGMQNGVMYTLGAADQKTFETLFTSWEQAQGDAKTTVANELTAGIRDFEAKNAAGLKTSIDERVSKIRSILSAEQIKKFTDMGR